MVEGGGREENKKKNDATNYLTANRAEYGQANEKKELRLRRSAENREACSWIQTFLDKAERRSEFNKS